ncbi:hypothetical protein DVA67_025485 [Solirubrobacter sp. CPCC 204708]|uniref:Fibronectin type-III domain-containing protein n=1 Tax=Solirubrobacter deserti TaxID=2282478 RepID=A0ABT4RQS5_9ACTN|nr:hypothetical protein [Solirubrobacter deserti]MBE2319354.1 hypothetical protein [Solirubrobacter deserti]MDA0140852.1 hypothetical protein [Solirubrobacter deserti]
MAVTRIVDPRLFIVEAAMIDWNVEARRRKLDVKPRGFPRVVALRWHINGAAGNLGPDGKDRGVGLPTGPFTVWRRPSFSGGAEVPIGYSLTATFLLSGRLVLFHQPVAWARLSINSASGGAIHGLSNAPSLYSLVTTSHAPGGATSVEIHGGYMNGLLIPSGMSVTGVTGIPVAKYEALPNWQPVEIVGMPVDTSWSGIGTHFSPQGPVGPPLMSPRDAAISRIDRGTPGFGWDAQVMAGVAAPVWKPPVPAKLVDEVNEDVVPALRTVLTRPQRDQAATLMDVEVPPPATLDGDAMNANPTKAKVSPLMLLRVATAADPFLSLALGYGTNLPEITQPEGKAYHDGSRWDWMITAPYAKGLDGNSAPVELVAYALRPIAALPPFPPAQLASEHSAFIAPAARDADWAASAIVRWNRPPSNTLIRVASYAAARNDTAAAVAAPLMEPRPSGGHKPIAPGQAEKDPQSNFVHLADRRLMIPNNPGERNVRYSVATQSIFSLWSPWLGVGFDAQQPLTPAPRIVAATLAVTAPASGKLCTGELTVDVTWDWTDRRPKELRLVGRMYAAADRAAPPPSTVAPAVLQRAIGGAAGDQAVTLTFSGGDAAVQSEGDLVYLNPEGDEAVDPGEQGEDVRRYRLTIEGLQANFTATPHIGLVLWLSGTELIAPEHPAAASAPVIAYASDPVAPPVPPELVPLASLPDAEGRSHARISWPVAHGAAGYVVYTSDELTMLAHYGAPEPDLSATLSDRATALLDLWEASPDRRPFTRVNTKPLTGTSLDVALPAGSTAIHAYAVVSLSPGGVEGPWPAGPDVREAVILRAAPRIATPAPPMLEALAKADGSVKLTVTARDGHRVGEVDLYRVRVDDAARSLDTMGPPLNPAWNVNGDTFTCTDVPGGSWKRVWYRAVAWADEEFDTGGPLPYKIAERGLVRGRSAPSNPVSVVTPPAGDPNLSAITTSWPGSAAADVQLDWTTTAPLAPTALGPHKLEVVVRSVGAADPLFSYFGELGRAPTDPPGASENGFFRVGGGSFRALVRRAVNDPAIDVSVRVIDPLGRSRTRTLHVPAGSVLPAPELLSPQLSKTPGGIVLQFACDAPLERYHGLAYMLRVQATPESAAVVKPFPVVERPGALVPSRDRGTAVVVKPPFGPPLAKTLLLEIALPDIPRDQGQPPGNEPLQVRRGAGGRKRAYAVLARVPVKAFKLRLTAPDGRSHTIDVEVS